MKKIINASGAPAPVGPYNQAVRHGNTLYLSGQIAIDQASGTLVTGDIVSETHRVLQNIRAVLQEAGADMENLLKCTIFVTDIRQYSAINEVYASYFREQTAPARELVEVSHLPKGVHIEISAIAGL